MKYKKVSCEEKREKHRAKIHPNVVDWSNEKKVDQKSRHTILCTQSPSLLQVHRITHVLQYQTKKKRSEKEQLANRQTCNTLPRRLCCTNSAAICCVHVVPPIPSSIFECSAVFDVVYALLWRQSSYSYPLAATTDENMRIYQS